jgi:pilus assembly protein Flp/PilA
MTKSIPANRSILREIAWGSPGRIWPAKPLKVIFVSPRPGGRPSLAVWGTTPGHPHPFAKEQEMSKYVTAVKKFFRKEEEGASLAEYGLLLALIAVICIGAIRILGQNISTMFSTLAGSL